MGQKLISGQSMAEVTRLEKLEKDIKELIAIKVSENNKNIKLPESKDCPICCNEIDFNYESVFRLECGHYLHYDCTVLMIGHDHILCPICRKEVTVNYMNSLVPTTKEFVYIKSIH